jgi:hypothetical protein
MGRLEIFMDEAALVELAQRGGDADGEAHNVVHRHGRAEQPLERLTARILKHQQGCTAFARQLQRPHRPRAIEFVLQSEFVSEPIEARR